MCYFPENFKIKRDSHCIVTVISFLGVMVTHLVPVVTALFFVIVKLNATYS